MYFNTAPLLVLTTSWFIYLQERNKWYFILLRCVALHFIYLTTEVHGHGFNQLGKFVPGLANINASLCQLLYKDSAWYWGEAQQTSFQQVKEKLQSPEVLAH